MFMYWPDNRPWSYHFMARLINAAQLGGACFHESHRTAQRIRPHDGESWYAEWRGLAERVEAWARAAETAGNGLTARDGYLRAFTYFRTAQFYLEGRDPRKQDAYLRCVQCFRAAGRYFDPPLEYVTIPYEGTFLSGYFFPPRRPRRDTAPAVAYLGGVDVVAEELYFFAVQAMIERGLGVLAFDGPGMGEPLRVRGIYARPDYEVAIGAAVDYLVKRPGVDPDRIALIGQSMGGFYGGRGAAFERRLRACIIWGACYDLRTDIYDFFPPIRSQIEWVIGAKNPEEARELLNAYTLKGVLHQTSCPLLITHGEKDFLVTVEAARKTYADANEPKELRIWTEAEGGAQHLMNDNRVEAVPYMADWLVRHLR